MNESGSRRLAIIYLESIKKFSKTESYATIAEEDELAFCSAKNPVYLIIKEKDKCPNVNLN